MSPRGALARRRSWSVRAPDTWSGVRIRLALYAAAVAALTAITILTSPFGSALAYGVTAYIIVVALAVFVPAAITFQVIGGQLLAGALWLLGGDGATVGALLVIASIVFTAELLAEVARLDSPLRRHPTGVLGRAGTASAVAAVIFGLLASVGELPSVTGLVAVVVGAAVCGWVAMRLVRSA